jgi:hypothetical protein
VCELLSPSLPSRNDCGSTNALDGGFSIMFGRITLGCAGCGGHRGMWKCLLRWRRVRVAWAVSAVPVSSKHGPLNLGMLLGMSMVVGSCITGHDRPNH